MPSKSKDEDRELQIELTRLQVKHEHDMTMSTVFLSVVVSMMLTTISVYVPLGQIMNNLLYPLVAFAFNAVLLVPLIRLARHVEGEERKFEKEIQDLKDRFLSRQAEEKKQSAKS
jgi:hypothetical protein